MDLTTEHAALVTQVVTGQAPRTDFERMPDAVLLEVLHRGSPRQARALADGWRRVALGLFDAAETVLAEHRRIAATWTGEAADEYQVAVVRLVAATRRVAETADRVQQLVHHCADSLELAQTMHPSGRDGGPR